MHDGYETIKYVKTILHGVYSSIGCLHLFELICLLQYSSEIHMHPKVGDSLKLTHNVYRYKVGVVCLQHWEL